MKILITGGTGTISSALAEECVKRGYDTYGITRGKTPWREVSEVHYFHCDIWDSAKLDETLRDEKFDIVVECIVYSVEQLRISLNNFKDRTGLYVFISTSGIFKRETASITENSKLDYSGWSYTDNKIKCEKVLTEYSEAVGLKYMIIRPPITYGRYRIPYPVATRNPAWTFFNRMLDGKPMLACNNVRAQMVYADDFSEAVVNLFFNKSAINNDYNVALNAECYWDEVVVLAAGILNIKPFIIHVSLEVIKVTFPEIYEELKWNKVDDLIMDGSKIKTDSGLSRGRVCLKEGLEKIISYMHTEYYDNSLHLDDWWNDKCDETIKYAYDKGLLIEGESTSLTEYYVKAGLL